MHVFSYSITEKLSWNLSFCLQIKPPECASRSQNSCLLRRVNRKDILYSLF